jgi:hypothetical protein
MSDSVFNAELQYQIAVSIAKELLSQGLLTKEEFAVIDTKLKNDFKPTLGTLLSENDLIK